MDGGLEEDEYDQDALIDFEQEQASPPDLVRATVYLAATTHSPWLDAPRPTPSRSPR